MLVANPKKSKKGSFLKHAILFLKIKTTNLQIVWTSAHHGLTGFSNNSTLTQTWV
jgi:hypothetical protein